MFVFLRSCEWRLKWGNHGTKWGFSIAMFDYGKVQVTQRLFFVKWHGMV
jgi:hypothetical protein